MYGYGSVAGVAIDTFKGTIAPGVTSLSYGSAVTITFKTNNDVEKKGFKVQFSDGNNTYISTKKHKYYIQIM